MKMSLKLTEEDISGCRRGSDIDIQAIFGGHISGKRPSNGKINPIFSEQNGEVIKVAADNQNNNIYAGQHGVSNSGDMESRIVDRKSHGTVDGTIMVSNQESGIPSRSERESLKVTNGDVFVGDIIIENGYKNQGFEGDRVQPVIKPSHDSGNEYPDTAETDSRRFMIKNHMSDSWPDLDEITLTESKVGEDILCNHDDPVTLSRDEKLPNGDVNHNQLPRNYHNGIHGIISSRTNHVEENGDVFRTIVTGSNENGVTVFERVNHDKTECLRKDDLQAWTHINGKKSPRQKIKERKNSVPEQIQNCVNIAKPKPVKPILVSGMPDHDQMVEPMCCDQHSEHKSVKFSDDTVFNDDRPNKYRRDTKLMNLREIYKGLAISNLAKSNPGFVDDHGGLAENSLTDDEKVARSQNQEDQIDIESLGGQPRYDRLIKQTIARQRRSKLIRLILAFLAFLVVIAAVVLLVLYFGMS